VGAMAPRDRETPWRLRTRGRRPCVLSAPDPMSPLTTGDALIDARAGASVATRPITRTKIDGTIASASRGVDAPGHREGDGAFAR
jgi:hypothetical protein